jgi:hypothetical protein
MTSAHDFFMSFTVYNLGMYEEFGMRTRHVVQGYGVVEVQGYGVVVFKMELGGLL